MRCSLLTQVRRDMTSSVSLQLSATSLTSLVVFTPVKRSGRSLTTTQEPSFLTSLLTTVSELSVLLQEVLFVVVPTATHSTMMLTPQLTMGHVSLQAVWATLTARATFCTSTTTSTSSGVTMPLTSTILPLETHCSQLVITTICTPPILKLLL